jgi:hypothetical protein
MPSLNDLVGKKIQACIPLIAPDAITEYTLHAVESSGLWVSSKSSTEHFMKMASRKMLAMTPVFFVPFQQIIVVLAMDEGVQVSDRVLE